MNSAERGIRATALVTAVCACGLLAACHDLPTDSTAGPDSLVPRFHHRPDHAGGPGGGDGADGGGGEVALSAEFRPPPPGHDGGSLAVGDDGGPFVAEINQIGNFRTSKRDNPGRCVDLTVTALADGTTVLAASCIELTNLATVAEEGEASLGDLDSDPLVTETSNKAGARLRSRGHDFTVAYGQKPTDECQFDAGNPVREDFKLAITQVLDADGNPVEPHTFTIHGGDAWFCEKGTAPIEANVHLDIEAVVVQ